MGIAGPYWFAAAVFGPTLGAVPVAPPVAPVFPPLPLLLVPLPALLPPLPLLPHPASTIAVLATMAVPSITTVLRLPRVTMSPLLLINESQIIGVFRWN